MPPRTRLGAVVWMCALQFFVAQAVVQLAWTTPFSLTRNFISDLGNTACAPYPAGSAIWVCSPWHAVMNASFVILGLTKIAGAVLIKDAFRPGWLRAAGLGLVALSAPGVIVVGLIPENVAILPHKVGAALDLLGGNLGIALLGGAWPARRHRDALAAFSIAAGAAGFIATVLLGIGWFPGLGVGGVERVAAYTVPLWLIVAGAHTVRVPPPGHADP